MYALIADDMKIVNLLLQRYRKHAKLSENLPVTSDAEGNSSSEQDIPVLTARKQSMLLFNVCIVICVTAQPVVKCKNCSLVIIKNFSQIIEQMANSVVKQLFK